MRRILLLCFIAVLAASPLSADLPRAVIAAFKGQIVITRGDLPEGRNDKDTIAKIKKEQVKELLGTAAGEDVVHWVFRYAAFLNQTGSSNLRLVFSLGGRRIADKHLAGIDPKASVLSGEISISEDEGIQRGKLYTLQLIGGKKVLAETKLMMK